MTRDLGDRTILVLKALIEGAKYGFEIVQRTGAHTATVYRSLRRLEKLGYVRSQWEAASVMEDQGRPRRRYYRVTRHGQRAFTDAIDRLKALTVPGRSGQVVLRPSEGKRS